MKDGLDNMDRNEIIDVFSSFVDMSKWIYRQI